MASNHSRAALETYLMDLSATLRDSERSAACIERHLSLVQRPPPEGSSPPPPNNSPPSPEKSSPPSPEELAGVLRVSVALVDESHRLLDNVRAGRALLRQLQAEFAKLRRE